MFASNRLVNKSNANPEAVWKRKIPPTIKMLMVVITLPERFGGNKFCA